MMYSEKTLNPVQACLPGFSAGMAFISLLKQNRQIIKLFLPAKLTAKTTIDSNKPRTKGDDKAAI